MSSSFEINALITGATGFLGRHLLEAMTDAGGWQPTALVRTPKRWKGYDWTGDIVGTDLIEGSLDDASSLQQQGAFDDTDVIFHLAGLVEHSRSNPEPIYRTNVDGTEAMVRVAAATNSRLVVASTSGVVGCFRHDDISADEQAPFCEETVARWPYYLSKIEMERRCRALADELGVTLVFVRPPMLFGPRDHRFRSTGIVLKLLQGKIPAMPNGKADFTDVRDVASALLRLGQVDDPRPIYHTPGTAVRVAKLFDMCREVSNVKPPRTDIPTPLLERICSANEHLSKWWPDAPTPNTPDPVYIEMAAHFWDSSSLWAKSDLDFQARSPYQTLADTIHWLRHNAP